jgi:hypothetical protein
VRLAPAGLSPFESADDEKPAAAETATPAAAGR